MKQSFCRKIIFILSLLSLFVAPTNAKAASSIDLPSLERWADSCVSPDKQVRSDALKRLVDGGGSIEDRKIVVELTVERLGRILSQRKSTTRENRPRGEERVRLIRKAAADHNIILDACSQFAKIENETALTVVLDNLAYFDGSLTFTETMYIDGLPVSSFKIVRAAIGSKRIEYKSVVGYLKKRGVVAERSPQYPPVVMYCLLQKLKNNGLSWEEGKKKIEADLKTFWDEPVAEIDKPRERLLSKLLDYCRDEELTEINASRYGLSRRLKESGVPQK